MILQNLQQLNNEIDVGIGFSSRIGWWSVVGRFVGKQVHTASALSKAHRGKHGPGVQDEYESNPTIGVPIIIQIVVKMQRFICDHLFIFDRFMVCYVLSAGIASVPPDRGALAFACHDRLSAGATRNNAQALCLGIVCCVWI